MKLGILFFSTMLFAQTPPGTVVVASAITATAGTLVCVGTASVADTVSTMHIKCVDGTVTLSEESYTVQAPGSTLYSIQRGANSVSWLLTKGNAIPDQWQVSANGFLKTGTF